LTNAAVLLILSSAFIHAWWNLLAKRAGGGGSVFVWLFSACSSIMLWPVAAFVWFSQRPDFGWVGFAFIGGTTVLHLLYFVVLQRGYKVGDLSLVYPLARGTGPTLSTIMAVIILGERPSVGSICGLVFVVVGVFLLTWRSGSQESSEKTRAAIKWGILCGICIAIYSVWDKYAVTEIHVPPILLELLTNFGVCLMLTPHAMKHKDDVRAVWKNHRREVIGVALLAPLSYILVLTAMSFTPLSTVAPAREISILIGAILGAKLLGEEQTKRRLVAAGTMVCGVVLLAVG
jgi:drug/metabolite transporter (DMT)-like permease